jgi:polysaccharide pyruvyl transferase WcaK-like protein
MTTIDPACGTGGDASRAGRAIAFVNPSLSTRNVGDLFIEDSVKRILLHDPERSIDVDPRKPITTETIARINQCDAAVIVGTNLWYRQIYQEGRWMIKRSDLEQIRIPIIPMGVGTTRHRGEDNSFTSESVDLLRAIHDRCERGSVRDLRTLEALTEAGVKNAVMTGCPTLFRSLKPDWRLNSGKPRKVIVTVRKGQKRNVRLLLKHLRARGWEVRIAAQQDKDNFFARTIPFVQRATPTLYEYNLQPYLNCTQDFWGAIGWRLHGNMLHLAQGNPAVFFANCSRAESFCRSFGLPCIVAEDHETIPDGTIQEAIERLSDAATYASFPAQYRHYRAEMAAFLETNRLAHNLVRVDASQPALA